MNRKLEDSNWGWIGRNICNIPTYRPQNLEERKMLNIEENVGVQLEVGKQYLDRNLNVVTIKEKIEGTDWDFYGDNFIYYSGFGSYGVSDSQIHVSDLIAELPLSVEEASKILRSITETFKDSVEGSNLLSKLVKLQGYPSYNKDVDVSKYALKSAREPAIDLTEWEKEALIPSDGMSEIEQLNSLRLMLDEFYQEILQMQSEYRNAVSIGVNRFVRVDSRGFRWKYLETVLKLLKVSDRINELKEKLGMVIYRKYRVVSLSVCGVDISSMVPSDYVDYVSDMSEVK